MVSAVFVLCFPPDSGMRWPKPNAELGHIIVLNCAKLLDF